MDRSTDSKTVFTENRDNTKLILTTYLTVSKFWTVNLSTHGVPLVGGTGVVVI